VFDSKNIAGGSPKIYAHTSQKLEDLGTIRLCDNNLYSLSLSKAGGELYHSANNRDPPIGRDGLVMGAIRSIISNELRTR
jgi:hypothetical protein